MKILFLDTVHPILKQLLEEKGFVCDENYGLNTQEVLSIIADYQGVVVRSKIKIDTEIIDAATQLKFIARSGAGLENIDVQYAQSKEIKIYNSPEGNRTAVAEQALGMILSLFNNLNRSDMEVRKGQWNREKNRGIELEGKTIGIIGYGFMGKAFSQRLEGFNVTVLAYDKYKTGFSNELVTEASLEQLFEQTDVLSIHLPLTNETHFMINEMFLSRFHKNIYLINTARGKNVKTSDLVKSIEKGKILGACLDVLEYEHLSFEQLNTEDLPTDFQYLIQSEKTLLSPHIAGWTQESYYKLSKVLCDKILADFK